MVQNYRDLEIFHLSYNFALKLYPYLNSFPKTEEENLCLQMKRSVVSIPLNIAEGSSRKTDREFHPFLGYAFGSAKELEVSLRLSKDFGFITETDHDLLYEDLQRLTAKLASFMQYIERKIPPKKDVTMVQVFRGENPWERRTNEDIPKNSA